MRTLAQFSTVPARPNNHRWPGDLRIIERVRTRIENLRTCLETRESSYESGRCSRNYVRAWRLENHRTSPYGDRESTYVPGDLRIIERVWTVLEKLRTCLETRDSSNEPERVSRNFVRVHTAPGDTSRPKLGKSRCQVTTLQCCQS